MVPVEAQFRAAKSPTISEMEKLKGMLHVLPDRGGSADLMLKARVDLRFNLRLGAEHHEVAWMLAYAL